MELCPGLKPINYAAPIGAFFCPEILALTGALNYSAVSKVRSDRKVLVEQKNGPLIAVNGG